MTCTFFGNRNTPLEIRSELERVLTDLIENHSVERFYVGDSGNFDFLVRCLLREMQVRYPHIRYFVVLAYMPTCRQEDQEYEDTIYPDGLETVPRRYAIARRNEWMLARAEYVVTYVRAIGGAKQYRELSLKRKKTVIDLV